MGHGFQPPPLGEDEICRLKLLRLRQLPAAQGVRIADDGSQGRFQLVGKGGGEVLLLLGGFFQRLNVVFQLLGHAVELGGKDANLVLGSHGGTDAVVAPGNLPGRAGEGADGCGQHGADGNAGNQAEHHRRKIHQPEGGEVLPPQGIQVGYIPAAFQIECALVYGEAAGDHQLVLLALALGNLPDFIGDVIGRGGGVGQPQAILPEGRFL